VKPFAPVFFVTESEYPKLHAACPGDFPFSYAQFVKRVHDGMAALGSTVRVEVSVAEFVRGARSRSARRTTKRVPSTLPKLLTSNPSTESRENAFPCPSSQNRNAHACCLRITSSAAFARKPLRV
jgi:hypothetical protein